MLEDSYICEANIEVARILRDRAWHNILGEDMSKPNATVMFKGFEIVRYREIETYHSIMLECHGGF